MARWEGVGKGISLRYRSLDYAGHKIDTSSWPREVITSGHCRPFARCRHFTTITKIPQDLLLCFCKLELAFFSY